MANGDDANGDDGGQGPSGGLYGKGVGLFYQVGIYSSTCIRQ